MRGRTSRAPRSVDCPQLEEFEARGAGFTLSDNFNLPPSCRTICIEGWKHLSESHAVDLPRLKDPNAKSKGTQQDSRSESDSTQQEVLPLTSLTICGYQSFRELLEVNLGCESIEVWGVRMCRL